MRRFRYMADPLCVICCAAYLCNRFLLKPHLPRGFFHGYFNDVLLIPCAIPVVLWFQRKLGIRRHDQQPRMGEVLFHLLIWSLLFELAGPHLVRHATGDVWDVVAYAVGAMAALLCWKRRAQFNEG
jgi:hypothetical protein